MELQHFSHTHPLVFNEEPINEDEKAKCSGCGEVMLGPSFSCIACRFYLHQKCAEASSELAHPFHHNHNLNLLNNNPYKGLGFGACDFCDKDYSFLKLGLIYKFSDHPHPLTLTRKVYDYPNKCHECFEPCLDAALECAENGCNYIRHWACVHDKSSPTLERLD
ncbi:C1-like protein [Corchorus olitorius]|uniref:C1-like protein n=1 Tax=Corchorus olitorius TaxID=93759 RepID=A0A1R3G5H1_9ROSI|nr:C1-like protein [Corchorus olitorius]